MTNVIQFRIPVRQDTSDRQARLLHGFANDRRLPDDVFWLKEVAEVLGIFAATGAQPCPGVLAPFQEFYEQIEERLRFFPQYYRFLLSICLDLEDLGMPGDAGDQIASHVASEGLVEAELSDLQRAEARRLMARRGQMCGSDPALDARLRQFISQSATFAMPNKKAAYELTHIVFYLSDYGARDPELGPEVQTSLTYCGLLAYLDQNTDLLAEVCVALRFIGAAPSPVWERAVAQAHRSIQIVADATASANDAYHEFLVTGWMLQVVGQECFAADVPVGAIRFHKALGPQGALRTMSECMFALGDQRSSDWDEMRAHVLPQLGQSGHDVLASAEQSTDQFAPFFARFARAVQG